MAVPTLVAVSTGATDAGGAWSFSALGATWSVGDIFIFQLLQDGATSGAVAATGVTNLEALDGTDSSMTFIGSFDVGASSEAIQHLWIGRKIAGATPTISGTNSTSEDLYGRFYVFSNVSTGTTLATVIENGTAGSTANSTGTSATISDTAITTLGPDRMGLQFIAVNDDNNIGHLPGYSRVPGVTPHYADAAGTDGAIDLQYASITTAQVYGGGNTVSIVDSDAWGVVSFALIGTTVASGDFITRRDRMQFLIAQ